MHYLQELDHAAPHNYLGHIKDLMLSTTLDLEEHFIQVPPVAGPRGFASQVVGITLAELKTPFSDCLIAEGDATHG